MAGGKGSLEGLVVNPGFWRDKSVFLTGHTGFKGGWLSLWLQHLGARVTGFSLPPSTNPNLFEIGQVAQGMTSIIGDVRDVSKLRDSMLGAEPEIVIHMAAQPLVRRSYADPVETYSTNVMGTVNLFEAVRQCPSVRAVVNVTTDKCYENREWCWAYRESEPMGGYDPYSSSKGCAELVSSAYRRSFFAARNDSGTSVPLATARAGNVIGGGDWAADRLVPDVLFAFSNDKPVVIRSPGAIRPWQHVLEPIRGYLTLAERLYVDGQDYAEAFNFGPRDGDVKPVGWVVSELSRLWGKDAKWTQNGGQNPHEATLLKLDISKASHRLGWTPQLNLVQALGLTVDWTRRLLEGRNMRDTTWEQISGYQDTLAAPTSN